MDKHQHRTSSARQPVFEVSDIFRRFGGGLEPLDKIKAKVVRDILNCRTQVLGGHKLECDTCGHVEYSYNSCRNRHCPKCQFLAKSKWIEARKAELLPVEYFHSVFAPPHDFNHLIWCNKELGFNILFRAVSETLKEVAETRLKAKIGFTAVLHTWSQTLLDHAHIHAIVPGGGLSLDGKRWRSCKQGYLLPRKVLATVFRGKFLDYLEQSYDKLKFPEQLARYKDPKVFKSLLIGAAGKEWVVYAKAPFAGPKQVLEYLGNYTHRIAISNHRITNIENNEVTFRYRDRADGDKQKLMTLSAQEFMRRFLLHVLPEKFVRIRHFGSLGSRNKVANLDLARDLLGAKRIDKISDESWQDLLQRLTGIDITSCPCCKKGRMIEVATLLPHQKLRQKWRDTS